LTPVTRAGRRDHADATGRAEGNERLTAMTGAALLVLFAAEGATILSIRRLLTLHFFLGMLLLGPVALKVSSTGYRFVRYYTSAGPYVRKGPPPPLMRLLGPLVMATSLAVLGTGVALALPAPGDHQWLFLHKASFILWFGVMTIHVLVYAPRLPRLLLGGGSQGRARAALAGRGARWLLLTASLACGLVLAVLTLHLPARWDRGAAVKPSAAAATRLCGQAGWPETPVDGGAYIVQNDEWNSTASECITTHGGAQFTVTSSSIYEPASGDPGGYPAIYSGCSAGACTTGNKMPIQVSHLTPGTVTTSWATTQPRSGAYDVAYDIWFNHTPATSGVPDGGELMIWLAHRGGAGVAPAGGPVARATIGGYDYTIWVGPGGRGFDQITYVMNRAVTSVSGLDIGDIAADAARRGYLAGPSYLVNVQAGFEMWQGGSGLETRSFALSIGR
jgi:hypothetical protein